jgi:hypothetical protein
MIITCKLIQYQSIKSNPLQRTGIMLVKFKLYDKKLYH